MKKINYLFLLILWVAVVPVLGNSFVPDSLPRPLAVGYSISISKITPESMQSAKAAGISCLQVGVNEWFDAKGDFKWDDNKMAAEAASAKKAAVAAGIKIAAIHMAYGQWIDLSLTDEAVRKRVVAAHKKVLQLCRVLQPEVVLFHPSWYLDPDHREAHILQLIKSVQELEKPVKDINAICVIENMTGPELYVERKGIKFERPLCRTVEEMMGILNRLPPDIYGAVDMNHILHPEQLIRALGRRLRFIHVADGDGAHELHYYPCSGKGMNNWPAIIDALYQAGYTGPFMYECHYKNLRDLAACYEFLYQQYIQEKYIRPAYQ
ncbi:sugar phosphate isomerase/epimerase family protein [Niabella soli]|uniref:sugar phosphate isomerase/epimerase family protein n=1 Tax=Niabella soli TaxID=446683 RepID=UPI0002499013|nr:TIM barrel protein [Niabella soli]